MTTRRHLVLDADPDDDLFDIVEANLVDPRSTGMAFFLDEVKEPAIGLTNYVFIEENGRMRVVFVVDDDTPVQYLTVESHDPDDAVRVADALARNLSTVSPEELREAAAANLDEAPGQLVRMALGAAPEADPETVKILVRGLRGSAFETRRAAIEAASLTQWAELEEPLRQAEESEQDPELKQFAATALDTLRQVRGQR